MEIVLDKGRVYNMVGSTVITNLHFNIVCCNYSRVLNQLRKIIMCIIRLVLSMTARCRDCTGFIFCLQSAQNYSFRAEPLTSGI